MRGSDHLVEIQDWLYRIQEALSNEELRKELDQDLATLDNPIILYQLVLRLSDSDIVEQITPQLSDDDLLQLLEERNNPEIRRILALSLQDPMHRGKLFLTETDLELRLDILPRLLEEEQFNPKNLLDHESDPRFRALLITYLDPSDHASFLEELVFSEEFVESRRAAARKITNQDVLRIIIEKEQNGEVRYEATCNLNDLSLLENLAINDIYWKVRLAALQKINAPDILIQALEKDPSTEIRLFLLDHVPSSPELASLAMNEPNIQLRRKAVEKIIEFNDHDTLMVVAQEEQDPEIRQLAIEQIDNQSLLSEIVKSSRNSQVQISAIERLHNVDILIGLFRSLRNLKLQHAIISRLITLDQYISLELLESESSGSLHVKIHSYLNSLNN